MKNEEEKDREMPSSSSFSSAKGLVNAVGGLVASEKITNTFWYVAVFGAPCIRCSKPKHLEFWTANTKYILNM